MTTSDAPQHTEILVADPDLHGSALYGDILGPQTEIVRVSDGRDALVKALRDPFDLIIADTHLPLIDGYALCAILRSDLATEVSPIVMVTSDARPLVRARATRVGADALLLKPIDADTLRSEAQRLIQRSRELRSRSDRTRVRLARQLSKSRSLLQSNEARRILSRTHERYDTTRPPLAPPPLRCPSCDQPLSYESSHIGGVSPRDPEQWDYFSCSFCGGRFEYRQRTRTTRRA